MKEFIHSRQSMFKVDRLAEDTVTGAVACTDTTSCVCLKTMAEKRSLQNKT